MKKKLKKKLRLGKIGIADLRKIKAGSWATYLNTAQICCTKYNGSCDQVETGG